MPSLLRNSNSWLADGTFKLAPGQFIQLHHFIVKMSALMINKSEIAYRKPFKKLFDLERGLNPTIIMVGLFSSHSGTVGGNSEYIGDFEFHYYSFYQILRTGKLTNLTKLLRSQVILF